MDQPDVSSDHAQRARAGAGCGAQKAAADAAGADAKVTRLGTLSCQ